MQVFDVAIRMEVEGAAFYRNLAKRATSEGFKEVFTMLAEDEERHKETFEAMKAEANVPPSAADASIRAAKIFTTFVKEDFMKHQSELKLYEEALEIEMKSIEYYTAQLEASSDVAQKRILTKIIEEERRHYDLLDDIIIMVERPESWVENAEFGVREEY